MGFSRHAAGLLNIASLRTFAGDGANLDANLRQSHFRPTATHWHSLINKTKIEAAPEKAKPPINPAPIPMRGGKGAKALAAFASAMAELLFPPPVNSGLRPVYIGSSMSIGGRRPEPD